MVHLLILMAVSHDCTFDLYPPRLTILTIQSRKILVVFTEEQLKKHWFTLVYLGTSD